MNYWKRLIVVIGLVLALVVLAACQSSGPSSSSQPRPNERPPAPTPTRGQVQREDEAPAADESPQEPVAPSADNMVIEGERYVGQVQWFDPRKGYGFIDSDSQGEIFVHFSGILGNGYRVLSEGQRVEFSIEDSRRGPEAVNVRVIGGEATVATPNASETYDEGQRFSGKVRWFDRQKGYGFIDAGSQGDIFVHYSRIQGEGLRELLAGQQVQFSIQDGRRGPEAVNVVVVE